MPGDMNLKTYFPGHIEEEPVFPDHKERDCTGFNEPLVPGSRFHDEEWVMAAGMLARGASFMSVSRAMGCSRTTLWRAYHKSASFRERVWWERQQLNKEAGLRLGSVRAMAVEQLERLVSQGDPATVRWVCDRMGIFGPKMVGEKASRPVASNPHSQTPFNPSPTSVGEGEPEEGASREEPTFTPADVAELNALSGDPNLTLADWGDGYATLDDVIMDDDRVPGAMRERAPPSPAQMALIEALEEKWGRMGRFPWTVNPEVEFPSLGSKIERAGGGATFVRR